MPATYADGQLAASSGTILSAASSLGQERIVNILLANVGGSSETVILTLTRGGSTARRIVRASLIANQTLFVRGLSLDPSDTLSGYTTNASSVDYTITRGDSAEFTVLVLDDTGAVKTSSAAVSYSGDVAITDDNGFVLGTGSDAEILFSTADASNNALVLALDDTSQALHVTDVGAKATDWNISATTDPNVYIHSNTTPATDYLRLGGHSGTAADIDVVGGATLQLQIAGTSEVTMTASQLNVLDGNSLCVGGSTLLTTSAAATAQVTGTAAADSMLLLACASTTDGTNAELAFLKSGNAALGSNTVVAADEDLGEIVWYGDDGTDYASIAASILCEVDGTPGTGDMPGRLVFSCTADNAETVTEVMRCTAAQDVRINNGGGLIVGSTTIQATVSDGDGTTALVPEVQVLGTAKGDSSLLLASFNTTNDNTVAPALAFLKSGHATIGSNTTVAADEVLGDIIWYGADGTDFKSAAAAIRAEVDATVGTGDMPGRLVFLTTADGGETLTEAMRLTTAQDLRVNNGGGLIVGSTTAQVTVSDGDGTTNLVPEVQVLGTAKADASVLIAGWNTTDNATVAPSLNFLKSGHGTIGSQTIVASGEILGEITFFGDDGVDYESPAAQIQAVVNNTPGAGDMPGRLVFRTTTDGGESLVERMRIAEAGVTLGVAGTTKGVLQFSGNTSGVISVMPAAAAGTWTLTLPPDDGDAGEQLQTDGSGTTTWEAAGSLRAVKNVIGEVSHKANDVLQKLLGIGVYEFTYKEGARPTTGDRTTVYTGVMAEECEEVMHHGGRIFSPVSAFGQAILAIKALAAKVEQLEARLA